MRTYQDYEKAVELNNVEQFLSDAIEDYKGSYQYKRAIEGQIYYDGENTVSKSRTNILKKLGIDDSKHIFLNIRCGIFMEIVTQRTGYLLANGVTLDNKYKEMLGDRFDAAFQELGEYSLIDGTAYAYWNPSNDPLDLGQNIKLFRATEYFPLKDGFTNKDIVGVRFYDIVGEETTSYVELYTKDTVTTYQQEEDKLNAIKQVYHKTKKNNAKILDEMPSLQEEKGEGYSFLPVIPLRAGKKGLSELTPAVKVKIDGIDLIDCDLVDQILQDEGGFWYVKNFQGEDERELVQIIKEYKTIALDGKDTDAQNTKYEAPYEAKQFAINNLKKGIYKDTCSIDSDLLTNNNLRNQGIKAAMQAFGFKVEEFEKFCNEFIRKLFLLLGVKENVNPVFKKRSLTDDTQTIDDIVKFRDDIDLITSLVLNPYISEEKIEEIKKTGIIDGVQLRKIKEWTDIASILLSDGCVDAEWIIDNHPFFSNMSIKEKDELKERVLNKMQEDAENDFKIMEEEEIETV